MLAAVATELSRAGFDLVHPFDVRACASETGAGLDTSRGSLGLFVGNTRALWPIFSAARATDPELAAATDPLELYTERVIDRVAAAHGARVYYSHRMYDGAFLPLQRLAVAAGIGTLSPTHFVIHPVYGPWFALRAVIVGDGEPPPRTVAERVCTCDQRCIDAFTRAVDAKGPERWRAWLAVRDACTAGREHRYSDEQIAYHYSFLK